MARRGEVPSVGAPLFLIVFQSCVLGSRTELVALESIRRIRPSLAPEVKSEELSRSRVESSGRAIGDSSKVTDETDDELARPVALERPFRSVRPHRLLQAGVRES